MTFDLTGAPSAWPAGLRSDWADSLREALRADDAWHGPRLRGDPALLEVLGNLHDVEPSRIIVTSGVRAAVVALAAYSSVALLERPTFAQIPALFHALGVPVRCASWPDLAALAPRPRQTIWVTSPARNPDGATIDRCLAGQLCDVAVASGGFMVINETYFWYSDWSAPRGCTRVGSLSKLVGGGARLGWVIDPPTAAEPALARLGPATTWQRAWAAFLARTGRDRLTEAFIGPVTDARQAFLAAAGDLAAAHVLPGDGPSVLIPLGRSVSERQAASLLADRGILAGLGRAFLAERPSIRLAFTGLTVSQATAAGHVLGALLRDEPQLVSGAAPPPDRVVSPEPGR